MGRYRTFALCSSSRCCMRVSRTRYATRAESTNSCKLQVTGFPIVTAINNVTRTAAARIIKTSRRLRCDLVSSGVATGLPRGTPMEWPRPWALEAPSGIADGSERRRLANPPVRPRTPNRNEKSPTESAVRLVLVRPFKRGHAKKAAHRTTSTNRTMIAKTPCRLSCRER